MTVRHELIAEVQGWPAGTEVRLLMHAEELWHVRVVGKPVLLDNVPQASLGVRSPPPPEEAPPPAKQPFGMPPPPPFGHPEFRAAIPLPGTWERVRVPLRR